MYEGSTTPTTPPPGHASPVTTVTPTITVDRDGFEDLVARVHDKLEYYDRVDGIDRKLDEILRRLDDDQPPTGPGAA